MKSKIHTHSIIALALSTVLLAGCAGTKTQSSTGEYIDDSVVTSKVLSELAASDETSAADIEVETFRGVVQLSGFVDSRSEKQAAKRIAKTVEGVREVEDNLIVKN
jgi:hyperosmotically inducible periplasmic protein